MPTRRHALRLLSLTAAGLASGCGTVLYPERAGQGKGQLDVGIVVLDALWVLVGVIPGIVAFAIDFGNGCIYLPEPTGDAVTKVPVPPNKKADYDAVFTEVAGRPVALDDPALRVLQQDPVLRGSGLRALRDAPSPAQGLLAVSWEVDPTGVVLGASCV